MIDAGDTWTTTYPDGSVVTILVLLSMDCDTEGRPDLFCRFTCQCGETWEEEATREWLEKIGEKQ